jgi:hypothetical protein
LHSETITTQEIKFKSKLKNQLHLHGNSCTFKDDRMVKQSINSGFFKLYVPNYYSPPSPSSAAAAAQLPPPPPPSALELITSLGLLQKSSTLHDSLPTTSHTQCPFPLPLNTWCTVFPLSFVFLAAYTLIS